MWEALFRSKIQKTDLGNDPGHDLAHFERVVRSATRIALEEGAVMEIVLPAAWLHDIVNVPKDDPRRSAASRLSASEAVRFLQSISYPEELLPQIAHAIEAHSYSAGIACKTLEAKVVQDADRLDGLGAIGIARCFGVGARMNTQIYHPDDPFAEAGRTWNDQRFSVDHFYVKLFKVADQLHTSSAREEGRRRVEVMRKFLTELRREIS